MNGKSIFLSVSVCLFLAGAVWAAPPATINVHGSLAGADGTPLPGARAYLLKFFDAETGGTQLGGDVAGTVDVSSEGLFNIVVTPPAGMFVVSQVWYELAIDTDVPPDGDATDDVFPQRVRVHSVPFALEAGEVSHVDAARIGNGTVDNTELGFLDGVTKPLQAALDSKAGSADLTAHTNDKANPHMVTAIQVGLGNVDNTADANKPISAATQMALDARATGVDLATHTSNTSNPHLVTAEQVGLGNVDNTADVNKPVSTTTQAALDAKASSADLTAHTGDTSNPHLVTKAQVGLDLSDNTADADKPVSTATQAALDAKASNIDLTTHKNDLTNPHMVTAAQVGLGNANNTADADKPVSTAMQAALDARATGIDLTAHTTNTSNPHLVTAAQVGLGSVDNTADVNKPVSTATQAALDAKASNADLTTHTGNTSNPHLVTAVQVGLGSVDNTADVNKPVSTAAQAELDTKANTADVSASQAAQDVLISGKFSKTGTAHVIVTTTDSAVTNATNLTAAYAAARDMINPNGMPRSATNRVAVIVPPGSYDLGAAGLTLDAECVDLVGLSTARDNQYLLCNGDVLIQTAADIHIENLLLYCSSGAMGVAAYYPNATWNDGAAHTGSPPATVIRNCEFKAALYGMRITAEFAGRYEFCTSKTEYAFGGYGGTASGTFTSCIGGNGAFCSQSGGAASGTFTNCTGGNASFGRSNTASGTFINCIGGTESFGGLSGTASGNFTNCTGGDSSFGGNGGTANGNFTNCKGGNSSFGGGGFGTTASGKFTYCIAGDYSFGGGDFATTASGTFTNCTAGNSSFGGGMDMTTTSGTFTNCTAGDFSFGGGDGPGGMNQTSGTFTHCTAGQLSFGTMMSESFNAKFYYCSGGDMSFMGMGGTYGYCLRNGAVYP